MHQTSCLKYNYADKGLTTFWGNPNEKGLASLWGFNGLTRLSVVFKLKGAAGSHESLVKTQMAGPHSQSFGVKRSAAQASVFPTSSQVICSSSTRGPYFENHRLVPRQRQRPLLSTHTRSSYTSSISAGARWEGAERLAKPAWGQKQAGGRSDLPVLQSLATSPFYKTRPWREHNPGVQEHICLLWETSSNIHLNDSIPGNVVSPLLKPYD